MTDWVVLVEMTGEPNEEQVESMLRVQNGATVHYNSEAGTVDLRFSVEAEDAESALLRAGKATGGIRKHLDDGVLRTFRFCVQMAEAYEQSLPILSTAGVARRLGVSDARVRKLTARPDFPKALTIPGAAGAFYHAAAIDEFAAGWDRTAKGGRPRSAVQ